MTDCTRSRIQNFPFSIFFRSVCCISVCYISTFLIGYPVSLCFAEEGTQPLKKPTVNSIDHSISPTAQPSTKPLSMIDPGHGGEDRGAGGPRQLVEKNIVLLVARRVVALLREGQRYEVALTRDTDIQIPLQDRTKMANERGAALFVSLHTNASQTRVARGLTTYYLDNSDDAASRVLAERENESLRFGDDSEQEDLAVLLSSLIQTGKMEESIVLAHTIHDSVLSRVSSDHPKKNGDIRDLGVKKAPFYVLVGAHMPCVLVELFFIDNKNDAALLSEESFRESLARGVVRGIENFFERNG
jgi:N-acetylmuramoyl-L-alanine amidase